MPRSHAQHFRRILAGTALLAAGLGTSESAMAGGGTAVSGTLKNHATDTTMCTFTIKVRSPQFPNNSYTVEYALTNNKYGVYDDAPYKSESAVLSNTDQSFSFSTTFDVPKSDFSSFSPKYFKLRLWSRSFNSVGYIDYYVSANRCQ